jgi:hypothetical protein
MHTLLLTMMLQARFSMLVTAVVSALIVGGIFASSYVTSLYAKPIDPRFCYTSATEAGCFYTMGDCKKAEARFVSGGGTVEQHCFKNT